MSRILVLLVFVCLISACGSAVDTSSTEVSSAEPSTTTTTVLDAGAARIDRADVAQVWVPGGRFEMGTAEPGELDPPAWARSELASEQPAHMVTITEGFWLDRNEVTNKAFDAFVEADGYDTPAHWSEAGWDWRNAQPDGSIPVDCGDEQNLPRVCVTWYETEAYAAWRGGRLPTEAEWEYAARGPDAQIYPWGDTWDPELANVVGSQGLTPVGSYPEGASWVGAVDMAGNAMEWVNDWLGTDYYAESPSTDPPGPSTGTQKVEKGGWWGADPYVARSAYRHFEDAPGYQDHHIGFRIVSPG